MSRAPTVRDPRLDFFRGIAMFIILIAHIPGNAWGRWIPARFGPSDATEMFVFCSGFAAAIAFGGTFARRGFWMGVGRVLFRAGRSIGDALSAVLRRTRRCACWPNSGVRETEPTL